MVLITHVIIALLSVLISSSLLVRPSRKGFYLSYILIGSTILSGTYLVISTHSALLPACEAGLTYLVIVATLVVISHRRWIKNLAKEKI